MEALFIYLIKSGTLIAAFWLAYQVFLRKETFFVGNRWFLLFGLVASAALPLVTFRKVVWVDAAPLPLGYDTSKIFLEPLSPQQPGFEIDWTLLMGFVYAIGIFIFFIKFVWDFHQLASSLRGKSFRSESDFRLVDVAEKVSPYSYFSYIVYNSSLYNEADMAHILEHEKVHCVQRHSIDVLTARLFCILFWFNPFMWLYKKSMLQNLEFIADREALRNISDRKAYQMTMLKVTTHEHCVEITNHFYQSLIKKRIVMLNKSQSKKWNSWKYLLMLPMLIAFLLYFQVKVIAQEKGAPVAAVQIGDPLHVRVDKNTSDDDLKRYSEDAKAKGIKLKFSKIKRNSAGEITGIKAEYKSKDNSGVSQINGDEPIKPMSLFADDHGAIGFANPAPRIYTRHHDDNDEDNAEAPEPPTPPTPPSPGEAVEPPTPPMPPAPENPSEIRKHVMISKDRDSNGKVTISVNGETYDTDDAEAMADLDADLADLGDISFNFDTDEMTRAAEEAGRQARIEMRRARPEMERARRDADAARPEMEHARREMEEARRQMDVARAEMEKQRAEFKKMRDEMMRKNSETAKTRKQK